jgi:OOP family OmpA-OmpF porin
VNLTGHADPVGSASSNLTLGQLRAEAVAQKLLEKGVLAGQILSVTSRGEADSISTGSSDRWKDRRVDVVRGT